ncbi:MULTISPECIES: L-glutamate gamma-semialdehyde dehydrogenase [Myroides]|jgi:1-pyrroline-5-carboxylate dehydrogenase|uniref:L-glutamate gamma-semialdehyde dehydrogenase n=1 Tax=Myroides odoratus TaxID=256 RepID=A0A378RVQ8_MYROD|nr:L-glutamate gamma-semialdehyde dehydrogenase [Myroides odoratus]MDH6601860.1 1-pyrroline-5-carboxylate dehydrogenase [Myroides gitamensis]EHQ42980.1 delta-1-pyrroline-5-carboxylate dehydrogenase [Myroides odoratus DSM 2801]EKB07289.1 1-pyrroline-5-carboxylate dehydrogenase [Myroides odoratus CIP 103059]MCS4237409.1 1-pyrroline-5-carboxylate dehydrogenase [Myroides odoratus]MDR0223900.1 L-glutamate gamma-semialdehyde dehydrogenase [Myroides odoratus]
MSKGFYKVPSAINEPVKSYAPGTQERELTLNSFKEQYSQLVDIPLFIGGEEIRTGNTKDLFPPFDHKHKLGVYHQADKALVEKAIATALEAKTKWAAMPWEHRAAIFLKAAELLAGPYRAKINAATMIAQAKTLHQAEIDAACEFIDFLRFNVEYMSQIYSEQPLSVDGVWNRLEHRPLEGFVYAITPFNFTAISGNLPSSVAMMGNVVVWKPSATQIYSARVIVEVFKLAGLPDGVINVVYGDSAMITDTLLASPDFAGIHFTGSTGVFNSMWTKIGQNINNYKTYPRIVGETGGKDYVLAHPSSCPKEVAVALTRGAFEYQGQKCSAASRAYIPASLWPQVKDFMAADLATIKMGTPEDPSNFVSSVISESSFDKLAKAIEAAKAATDAEVVLGGKYDKSVGYFVEPTVILTSNPKYDTMETELFGPVLTIYVYEDAKWTETLKLVDETSAYALTGAIFSQCRYAIAEATEALVNSAGNFYINDKPTGAVVGQQPFGGARASGTNDKAGSILNLLRWVSPRTIKETFVPAKDYKYPFLG